MFLITLFLYGTDLDRLNSRDFAVREVAQSRLERAGWFAAPVLWRGMQADSPEVVERSAAAWSHLLGREAVPIVVCRLIDRSGRFPKDRDSWKWVRITPYLNGSLERDLQYALEVASK